MRKLLAVASLLFALSVLHAAPVKLVSDRLAFELDPSRGLVLSGQARHSQTALYGLISGVYYVGKPKTSDPNSPFDCRQISESADELLPGTDRLQQLVSGPVFTARYTNPGLPGVIIEKTYSLPPKATYLVKKLTLLPARDLGLGLEYGLDVQLNPAFVRGGYYHCPMGVHFGQVIPTWMKTSYVTDTLSMSGYSETQVGGGSHGQQSFVTCTNPALNLSAVTYRYRENGRFVRPPWMSYLGSGVYLNPGGWKMGVFSAYLQPGSELSGEVHIQVLPGDHVTAHREWQKLPGWQQIVHDHSVQNDVSPAWLDRVKVMGMVCEGVLGPLQLRDTYASLVNEGPQMVMVAGPGVTVWSGDGPIGTVYFEDGELRQKADHHVIHNAQWFCDYLKSFREVCAPGAKLGLYHLSPEISTKISTRVGVTGCDTWLAFHVGVDLPADLDYIRQVWRSTMAAHGTDFIYMDGAAEFGGGIDYQRKRSYHQYDAMDIDKAVRQAARSLGPDKVYWRNGEVNTYTDCGFGEFSGEWSEKIAKSGWRNLSDRLMKVKLYERPGKWQAVLYPGRGPEWTNYVLMYGFRPWGQPPSPVVNAMYEIRNAVLLDADVKPCWWRDYGEVEAHALSLGATRFLSALNHDPATVGEPAVSVSADRDALGLDPAKPTFIWECRPTADTAKGLLDDHQVQQAWGESRWAKGVGVRRWLRSVSPRLPERVGAQMPLPYNHLRQTFLSQVPALIYAANGYRRNYPLTDFGDITLRGSLDLKTRKLNVTATLKTAGAEIALVAPRNWRFTEVRRHDQPVAFQAVRETGASLALLRLPAGTHQLTALCAEAPELNLTLRAQGQAEALARYVPGVDGQALYLGQRSKLLFSELGPWDLTRGTLEFDFRPDFAATGDTSHILVAGSGERFSFMVYKLLNHDGLCFNIHDNQTVQDHPLHAAAGRWEPQSWHRVKVSWDARTGFEEVLLDGKSIGRKSLKLPDLTNWQGSLHFGRHLNDTWIGTLALDNLSLSVGEKPLFALTFEGNAYDSLSSRRGHLRNTVEAGESVPLSFTMTSRDALPAKVTPYLQLTRAGCPVLTRPLPATVSGRTITVTNASLAIPALADGGDYSLYAGVTEAQQIAWPEVAEFTIKARPSARTLSYTVDQPLSATFDGHPLTRQWSYSSFGAADPSVQTGFDPATGVLDLANGTGYVQGSSNAVAVELSGLQRLAFECTQTDEVRSSRPALYLRRQRSSETFSGLMLDFHTPAGYTHRAALGLGEMTLRNSAFPHWGWGAYGGRAPLALVDLTDGPTLAQPRRFAVDLRSLAPADWDGRIVLSGVLQDCLLSTRLRLRLLPAAEAAGVPDTPAVPLQTNPVLKATRLRGEPVVDGNLVETQGPPLRDRPLTPFYDLGGLTRAKQQSTAWVGYTDAGLYVAVECKAKEIIASYRGEDVAVWDQDDVEAFLQPGGEDYYQFAANAVGGKYDGKGKNSAYNARWQAAAGRTSDGWTLELFLPWAAIEQSGPGSNWKLGLCRSARGGGGELSGWPVFKKRDFHHPESWAPLRFE